VKAGLRQSMAWLHTWSGLLLGWLLLAMFVTGTSAYFREEISLWMAPELHHSQPSPDTPALAWAALNAKARTRKAGTFSCPRPAPRWCSCAGSRTHPRPRKAAAGAASRR